MTFSTADWGDDGRDGLGDDMGDVGSTGIWTIGGKGESGCATMSLYRAGIRRLARCGLPAADN